MNKNSPVVMIHGMWSTPDILTELKTAFEQQGFTVHTPRLPYHLARTDMDKALQQNLSQTGINRYVDALLALIDTLPEPPILIGHSMGGLLAQLVAAQRPCTRLVLLSSAAPAGINGWAWSMIRTFGTNLLKFPPWRSLLSLNLHHVRYGIANTQSAAVQQDVADQATFESGRAAWEIGMWFLFRRPPTRVNYNRISCPVLVMGGTEDKITPIKIQRKIAAKYPGRSTFIPLSGTCHWTIGGSHLPGILQAIFNWMGDTNKQAD